LLFASHRKALACAALVIFAAGTTVGSAAPRRALAVSGSNGGPAFIPTGQYINATATPGSVYQRLTTGLRTDGNADADSAVSSATSPDGKTLLVLTSGFNVTFNAMNGSPLLFPVLDPLTGKPAPFYNPSDKKTETGYNQSEFVFVFDVTHGTPRQIARVPIPDTYSGLAWDPNGGRFYVSGGIDDRILIYKETKPGDPTSFAPDAPFIILGHNTKDDQPLPNYDGGILKGTPAATKGSRLVTGAVVAGFDLSRDGKTLVAANFENASASIVDTSTRKVVKEIAFSPPGSGLAHGEFPYWVAVKSDYQSGAFTKAYVSSQRDDEVDVVTTNGLSSYIKVPSAPNKMVLDADGTRLYVACGNDDSIAVIDTASDRLMRVMSLAHPGDRFKGANPNSIAIGPFGRTLYVTLGGENAVAVVDVASGRVRGRIPTGWYPTSVSQSADGKQLYVVNEKSNSGPNPDQTYYSWNTPYGKALNTTGRNSYTWAMEKSGLLSLPTPDGNTLQYLSAVVDANNGFANRGENAMMGFLRQHIKHVIYIVNENRTFDQVLGDIGNGANGDARLAFFAQPITPNLHDLASNFVTLDNFYDSAETSGVGWNWSMQGHTDDFVEKTQPVQYGNANGLGLTYDWQGIVQNMNLGVPPTGGGTIFDTRITGILDPTGSSTILPGFKDPSASENADNLSPDAIGGYIWESALRAGKTVRNYGWQVDLTYYGSGTPFDPPLVRNPYAAHARQSSPSTLSIRPYTDEYYRAFDMRYPDIWRIEEWKREFADFVKNNNLPSLTTMTLPHDHTGALGPNNTEGLTTPELELADHDYAIGQLVETISHSPYWASTAIVMIEDDPQNGQDHVEAHRSIAHIISPYVKSHSVVHTTYTTVNALRTVEDLLGIRPLGLDDANAAPMSDVFSTQPNLQPFVATIPGSLCAAPVQSDLVPACSRPAAKKSRRVSLLHDGAWWEKMTTGMDFRRPDHLNAEYYNALLQVGITGRGTLPKSAPAPAPSGSDD
jgi:YVTN family beta-propeller protein